MDMKYIKHKGPKVDKCSICGKMKELTWDHVPPKAVLIKPNTYASTLFWDEGMPSAKRHMRHYQSGIKYRTVCADCNNVLIGKNDEAYKKFHSELVERLEIASLSAEQGLVTPSNITVPTRINRVLRAICGHFLAMKQGYDDAAIVDRRMRSYLQDEKLRMEGIYMFCWFYPYPTVVNARDFSRALKQIILFRSFRRELSWYGASLKLTLPDSILEKSRISLMMASRLVPALFTSPA